MTITINGFDTASIQSAISQLRTLDNSRMEETCERIASLGALRASLEFSRTPYSGVNDVSVTAESFTGGARVRASGNAVLFIEYGSGARYGYGHPRPDGYGPGTYPGKGHWNDPNGWWYGHNQHTYGNPPAAAMYHAEQDMREAAREIANEVYSR